MKKIVLLLSALVLCLTASAQEHLKFKNVPIDGSKKAFLENLQKSDFHLVEDSPAGASLRGRFTGRNASAFVMTTSEDVTCRVAVSLDAPEEWMALRMDFYSLLRSLAFKYGTPEESVQEFQLPFSDGDGRELEALRRGKGRWYARFAPADGTIHLTIANNPMSQQPCIMLLYEDGVNCRRQDELNSADL